MAIVWNAGVALGKLVWYWLHRPCGILSPWAGQAINRLSRRSALYSASIRVDARHLSGAYVLHSRRAHSSDDLHVITTQRR